MPNHGHEESGGDEEAGDGAVSKYNLGSSMSYATRHRSRVTCSSGQTAPKSLTTTENPKQKQKANLGNASQRGVGQSDEERAASNPVKKLKACD